MQNDIRIDLFLSQRFDQFSRSQWSEQISSGLVKINGRAAKSSSKTKNSDTVTGLFPQSQGRDKQAAPTTTPEVIYKDQDVIVINKPAGLLSHALNNKIAESVSGAFKSEVQDDDPLRAGIVHRLDKQTSGVMILARNEKAKKFLQDQFKNRQVEKTYTALVRGHLGESEAILELPISRSKANPQKMIISKQGKTAVSQYRTIQEFTSTTLVSIKIMTGRTHQIRVQMAYIGNPVVGDTLYGPKQAIDDLSIDRLFLHSTTLTIELPSQVTKTFEAPLPKELQDTLEGLR